MFKQIATFTVWVILVLLPISQANAFHEGSKDSEHSIQQRNNPYDQWVYCRALDSSYDADTHIYYSEIFGGEPSERRSYAYDFASAIQDSFNASTYSHDTFCQFFDTKRQAEKSFRTHWRKYRSLDKMQTNWTPDL